MGVVARINRWVLTRLARKRGGAPRIALLDDGSGLSIMHAQGRHEFLWHSVIQILAMRYESYDGDTMGLTIAFDDAQRILITEDDPLWQRFYTKIEAVLPSAMPYNEWIVALLAAPVGTPIIIFTR